MTENKPQLDPAIFVIFGITGDLSRHKLLPALYHLIKNDLLHQDTEIVGVSRRDITAEKLLDSVNMCDDNEVCDQEALKKMMNMTTMYQVDLTNGDDYKKLKLELDKIEEKHGLCMNRLFYLSIPPQVYGPIVRLLGERGLNKGCQHGNMSSRLLVEKPFGYDVESAKELIATTSAVFSEENTFRIDHYVAKETVQNITTFRSKNPLFSKVWDSEHIGSIQISACERIGIEGRITFYEETGALRDFIQSHLLQLLAIVMMDNPKSSDSESLHAAKLDLLKSIAPITKHEVKAQTVRGQYEGYRDEVSNPRSNIETYAAVSLRVESDRWKNVPVLVRTGKRLEAKAKKVTEISIAFKPIGNAIELNILKIRIQPDEGISLTLLVKKPGFSDVVQEAEMNFHYEQTFRDHGHPDAYERVLVDAVRGDRTLFSTSEEVLASWRVLDNVVHEWQTDGQDLEIYKQNSSGPQSSTKLAVDATGQDWIKN